MLLLPLFLWWAHSPLSIATGRIKSILCITVVFALLLVTFAPQTRCEAEDRLQQRIPANESGLFADPRQRDKRDAMGEKKHLLREGTLIPPTKGRIAMLGRRWTFISDREDTQRMTEGSTVISPIRQIDLFKASIASLQRARAVAGYSRKTEPVQKEKPLPTQLASTKGDKTTKAERNEFVEMGQILLSENLLLQRIVESIRADSSDDHWSVTGEISEFMGENRLLILTAQRAGAR